VDLPRSISSRAATSRPDPVRIAVPSNPTPFPSPERIPPGSATRGDASSPIVRAAPTPTARHHFPLVFLSRCTPAISGGSDHLRCTTMTKNSSIIGFPLVSPSCPQICPDGSLCQYGAPSQSLIIAQTKVRRLPVFRNPVHHPRLTFRNRTLRVFPRSYVYISFMSSPYSHLHFPLRHSHSRRHISRIALSFDRATGVARLLLTLISGVPASSCMAIWC